MDSSVRKDCKHFDAPDDCKKYSMEDYSAACCGSKCDQYEKKQSVEIDGWVARDKDECIYLYLEQPERYWEDMS